MDVSDLQLCLRTDLVGGGVVLGVLHEPLLVHPRHVQHSRHPHPLLLVTHPVMVIYEMAHSMEIVEIAKIFVNTF